MVYVLGMRSMEQFVFSKCIRFENFKREIVRTLACKHNFAFEIEANMRKKECEV